MLLSNIVNQGRAAYTIPFLMAAEAIPCRVVHHLPQGQRHHLSRDPSLKQNHWLPLPCHLHHSLLPQHQNPQPPSEEVSAFDCWLVLLSTYTWPMMSLKQPSWAFWSYQQLLRLTYWSSVGAEDSSRSTDGLADIMRDYDSGGKGIINKTLFFIYFLCSE